MIRPIVQSPANILLRPSRPVNVFGDVLGELFGDLIDTRIHHDRAYGLSAVQIGVPIRVVAVSPQIVAVSPQIVGGYSILVNPEIIDRGKALVTAQEGCLSIGHGVPRFQVERHKVVAVRFVTKTGATVEVVASDLAARVIQHEIDHLDGKLIAI